MQKKKQTWKDIWLTLIAMFNFRPRPKFYTTYTRRLQLIQQVRNLKRQSDADQYKRLTSTMRERLNVEFK